jgi:hypothetical protein
MLERVMRAISADCTSPSETARHEQRARVAPEPLVERHVARHGQPAQPDAEDEDHQEAEEEVGDREPEEGQPHERLVHRRVVIPGGDDPRGHAEEHGDQGPPDREEQRGLDPLHHRFRDGAPQEDRVAEIAGQQASVPVHELHGQRLVEAELAAELADVVGRGVRPRDDAGGIAGGEVDEHERQRGDDDHHGDHRQHPPEQIDLHARLTRGRAASCPYRVSQAFQ